MLPAARTVLLLGLSLLPVACDGSPAPRWVHLAAGAGEGEAMPEASEVGTVRGRPIRMLFAGGAAWLESTILREDWEWDPRNGVWRTPVWLRGRGEPLEGGASSEELLASGQAFRPRTRAEILDGGFPPGSFFLARPPFERDAPGTLALRLPPGVEPPERASLRILAGRLAETTAGRLDGHRFTGEGIWVWPGRRVERSLAIPEGAALRFGAGIEPAVVQSGGAARRVTFRVRLDGEVLFERSLPAGVFTVERHVVPLPERRRATLSLEVDGAPAHTAFYAPVVGPADVGTYGRRPWGRGRPDVVLFLADTFRADNMQVYGSDLPLTPNLDRLARESLLFERAWSVATYTMPAHASLFTGLFARQAAATTTLSALPEEVETIAELLSRRGYRTGAVTDSVVVSQKNNLDQGFEWFDELHGSIESTIERVRDFLDADDGRPVFLFVQTYRTHTPYRVTTETHRRLGDVLGVDGAFYQLSGELQKLAREVGIEGDLANLRKTAKSFQVALYETPGVDPEHVRRYEDLVDRLRALYRATAADLDRAFAVFLADLRERGLLESGYLVFTSDHGEAFNEHDKVFHGGKVWGETTRIPLLVQGPGVEPGVVEHPVSLVDLAPTLADMAGLEPRDWLGTSLLRLDRDRPVFSFENQGRASTFAVIDRDRKVMGYEDPERIERGEVFAAFDLGRDPGEREDVAEAGAEWPREALERFGPAVRELLVPRYGERAAAVDAQRAEELRALGYGGEE